MFVVKWLSACIMGAALTLSAAPAVAEGPLWLSEIRGGPAISGGELIPGSWVIPQVDSFSFSNLESVQFDLYWRTPLPEYLRYLGSPRPFVGGILSLGGRESSVHWGWQWHAPIGDTFYLETAVGNGVHNGLLSGAAPPLRNLGCRFLYHWSVGAGVNVTENVTLTAQLQHMSNILAGCKPNEGMNHFGVSLGWKF